MSKKKYEVGDTIKFSTINRDGKSTATRKIVEVHPQWGIGINYAGYKPYYLYDNRVDKIIKHTKQVKNN